MRSANPGVRGNPKTCPEARPARYSLVASGEKGASCKEFDVHLDIDIVSIQPLIALVFGILILILPRILNYLVAVYLILIGLVGLWPHLFAHLARAT